MTQFNIISNSSPLIAFTNKKDLTLLKDLFSNVIIPEAVYNELVFIPKKLEVELELLKNAIKNKWIIVKKLKNTKLSNLNLGKGETEALNLCFEINNPLLLIDEKKGRFIARSYKINTLGTLGVLILAKKRGLKTNENLLDNLDTLIKNDFYISSDVITQFLKDIKS